MIQLPHDFEQTMTEYLGKDEYAHLVEALGMTAPTSIRLNQEKVKGEKIRVMEDAERVPWCESGYYLPKRPLFTSDPLFHAGCYYVQEASSMFLSHVLKQYVEKPVVALDLCAAPGGKSTLALSQLPEGSLLIANEVERRRANILAENIIKWGKSHCIVTNNHAEDFKAFGGAFDVIICDAPCSGEGMFRKDPASIEEWSLDNVEVCWKRQRNIVSDIWHTLKEGGIFIYSTCTYNPHEDEENVEWIAKELGAEVLSCAPSPQWGLHSENIHFFPHKSKGEGFFISVMRKTSHEEESCMGGGKKEKKNKGGKAGKQSVKIPHELKGWLKNPDAYTLMEDDGLFRAFPTLYIDMLKQAERTLRVIHAGITLGMMKGKNLQPGHSLAMAIARNEEAFATAEVDEQQAIAYLRTEALQLSADIPMGYVLITYKDHPLGFVKNIGNRANNLYPEEWRIRSSYLGA